MSISGNMAGISFTGLASGIDTQSILNQLMQIEALPLQRMQQQQAVLANKQGLYGQLKSILLSFTSTASALNTAASFNPIKVSSSNSEVATATATSSATAGVYDLAVSGSTVYAGGRFVTVGGQTRKRIAALDATTGAALWQFQTGGAVRSNPATFLVEGRQHISVASGRALFVFALPGGASSTEVKREKR